MTLITFAILASGVIVIATLSWLVVGPAVGAVRDWRRVRALRRLNNTPEQSAGA